MHGYLDCKFINKKGHIWCDILFWSAVKWKKNLFPFEWLSYSNFIMAFSIEQYYESVFCKSTAGKSAVNDAAFPRQFVATRVQFRASVGKGAQFVSRKKIRSYESFSPWTSFLLLWPKKGAMMFSMRILVMSIRRGYFMTYQNFCRNFWFGTIFTHNSN